MVKHKIDNAVYADKELAHNTTLAVLSSDRKDVLHTYRAIETCMESYYEPFSVVFDDGILIKDLSDNSIQFILNINQVEDNITISTTNDRHYHLSMNHQLHDYNRSQNILTPTFLAIDTEFTNVFVSDQNKLTIGDHSISAFYNNQHEQLIMCDGIKRFGYLVAYNEQAYLLNNHDRLFLFLFSKPECDLSTRFRGIGDFLIYEQQIYFRTNYDYKESQDLIVKDIYVAAKSGKVTLTCATEINPDKTFQMEV